MTLFAWLLVDQTDLAFGTINHCTGGALTTPINDDDDDENGEDYEDDDDDDDNGGLHSPHLSTMMMTGIMMKRSKVKDVLLTPSPPLLHNIFMVFIVGCAAHLRVLFGILNPLGDPLAADSSDSRRFTAASIVKLDYLKQNTFLKNSPYSCV